MRRLSVYSTKKNRKATLEFLQEIGAMEIDALDAKETSFEIPFERMDTSSERIRFQKIADEIDYVIIHELTHLVHGDHSRNFWNTVEENMQDYKKYKDDMKEFL